MIPTQITGPVGNVASVQERLSDLGKQFDHGTWLPSVGGDATYTAQLGWWTRTGSVVTVHVNTTINVLGTGSQFFTNLPFRVQDDTVYTGTVGYWISLAAAYVYVGCYAFQNQIRFTGATAAAASLTNNIALFQNASRVILTVTYPTNA